MNPSSFSPRLYHLLGLVLALLIAAYCYRPALGGAFQLDDYSNLGGLANVSDADTAVGFVLSGTAGPLGRPLALASFALQAEAWPDAPAAFLAVNIGLHLANALLLFWCLYQLGQLRGAGRDEARLAAFAAAALWVVLPLLATSTLLVVQRMTTLSALFVLLGLGAYLQARRGLEDRPRAALCWMSVSLGLAALLAALAKESGLLLPTFVLVLEATLLGRPKIDARTWRIWQGLFLVLPTVMIVAYLATRAAYPDALVERLGFTAWERVMTQARMLWLYLGKAILGLPAKLGIYQGAPAVARSLLEPVTLLAVLSWPLLLAVAVLRRRQWPVFSFAVLWFLAGHLIESTVVSLELYFEHRNYLPIIGPVFALCATLSAGQAAVRRVATLSILALFLVNAYFLHGFASLWGEPSRAARYWATHHPDSVRAVTNLAQYQLAEESVQRGTQTLEDFIAAHPEHAYLGIQILNLGCIVQSGTDRPTSVSALERALPDVVFTYSAGRMLAELFRTVAARPCAGVDASAVVRLAQALIANRRYANDRLYQQFHYKLLASIARREGDFDAALRHLRAAIARKPSSELNMMLVTALADAGSFDTARDFIENARDDTPAHILRALVWRRDLADLEAYVRELEKVSESGGGTERDDGTETEQR